VIVTMKKFISVVMLVLFLMNVLGLYGVFLGLEFSNAQFANNQLDQDSYTGSDLMTIKVPLTVPYGTDNEEYVRVTGEFEHDGQVFRLVKQKLHRDTLYVVCFKDEQAGKIKNAMADYVKTFSDKTNSAKQNSKSTVPNFIKDFIAEGIVIQSETPGWFKKVNFGEFIQNPASANAGSFKHPPKTTLFV
jgi:hypothetical protein